MASTLKQLYNNQKARVIALFSLLSLTILLPLLPRGHIMTLDMAFSPTMPSPQTVTSSYLFRLLLHGTNKLIPSDIIEKLLFLSIFVLASYGMYILVQSLKTRALPSAAYLSALFYAVNPYTYSRFMAGQYSVLLGYALLPFFAQAFLRVTKNPTTQNALKLGGWATVIGIVSIHTLGLIALLFATGSALLAKQHQHQTARLKQHYKALFLGVGVMLLASSYWLVPLLAGQGTTAQTIQSFGATDTTAFATAGGNLIGKAANIIRLQGFWAEDRGLFLLPQDYMPAWGVLICAMWVLIFIGARALWRSGNRFILLFFGLGAAAAAVLALGLPPLPGYREPHKFVGLVALFYALSAGQGMAALANKYHKRSEFAGTFATACCGILLVAVTPVMFWGFSGQLTPRHYPEDWFAINQQLSEDKDKFQTVFLPWHLYMHFTFAGRIIANPAQDFFDKPVLVSNDPEFGGVARTSQDPLKERLSNDILPQAPNRTDFGSQLAGLRAKYVIFAKESDAPDYNYLDHQKDLELIRETHSLKLYRNQAWKD